MQYNTIHRQPSYFAIVYTVGCKMVSQFWQNIKRNSDSLTITYTVAKSSQLHDR